MVFSGDSCLSRRVEKGVVVLVVDVVVVFVVVFVVAVVVQSQQVLGSRIPLA